MVRHSAASCHRPTAAATGVGTGRVDSCRAITRAGAEDEMAVLRTACGPVSSA